MDLSSNLIPFLIGHSMRFQAILVFILTLLFKKALSLEIKTDSGLNFKVSEDTGVYDIQYGNIYLQSGTTAFSSDQEWFENLKGNLVLKSTESFQSFDQLGEYQGIVQSWKTTKENDDDQELYQTIFRIYENWIIFDQIFPSESLDSTSTEMDFVTSSFPSFKMEEAETASHPLGYLSYYGNMACPKGRMICTQTGVWGDKDSNNFKGGMAGGVPLVLFDSSLSTTAVLSPFSNFMVTSQSPTDDGEELWCGVMGSVEEIPSSFSVFYLLLFCLFFTFNLHVIS